MNVVIRREDGPISLLVDEIGDVVEVDEELFEPAPIRWTRKATGVHSRRLQTEGTAAAAAGHRKDHDGCGHSSGLRPQVSEKEHTCHRHTRLPFPA